LLTGYGDLTADIVDQANDSCVDQKGLRSAIFRDLPEVVSKRPDFRRPSLSAFLQQRRIFGRASHAHATAMSFRFARPATRRLINIPLRKSRCPGYAAEPGYWR